MLQREQKRWAHLELVHHFKGIGAVEDGVARVQLNECLQEKHMSLGVAPFDGCVAPARTRVAV